MFGAGRVTRAASIRPKLNRSPDWRGHLAAGARYAPGLLLAVPCCWYTCRERAMLPGHEIC